MRILLRLRKESTNLPVAPAGQDDGGRMENTEDVPDSDNSPDNSRGVETVENLKMNERCGNVIENKGSGLENGKQSGNPTQNRDSYALIAGMLLKRKVVGGMQRC